MTSDIKHYITYTLVALILVVIGGYTLFQFRHIMEGPQITITNKKSGEIVTESVFTLEGSTRNLKKVEINGRQTFIDESGAFTDIILLSNGYNVITISGEDKFHHKITEKLELVYQQKDILSAKVPEKAVAVTNQKALLKTN